jgi:hypothetical protein
MKKLFFISIVLFAWQAVCAQVPLGEPFGAYNHADQFGTAVSMGDWMTVAISDLQLNADAIRIFQWDGSNWNFKGSTITGTGNPSSAFGYALSMGNESSFAVGAPNLNGNQGGAWVYEWQNGDWARKGAPFAGSTNQRLGHSVSMPDANTVGIGIPNDMGTQGTGIARVYRFDAATQAWVKKGNDIAGKQNLDKTGFCMSMPDANTIALGAPYFDKNGNDAGSVGIYQWNGSAWVQKGQDLYGEKAGASFGFTVSMPDANTIAIGAPNFDGKGQVTIYSWNAPGSQWVKKGHPLPANDLLRFGFSVSMVHPEVVAVGAPGSQTVVIYLWNGSQNKWEQKGDKIRHDNNRSLGHSVSMAEAIFQQKYPKVIAIGDLDDEMAFVYITVNGNYELLSGNVYQAVQGPVPGKTITYQWMDANNPLIWSPISGATGRQFTPTTSGKYVLKVTVDGETASSAVFEYTR